MACQIPDRSGFPSAARGIFPTGGEFWAVAGNEHSIAMTAAAPIIRTKRVLTTTPYSAGGPRYNFLPSGSVTPRPAIRFVPSLDRQPVTEIVSPTFSASLVQPVLRSVFGGCPSKAQLTTVPSSPLTSI